MSHSDTEIVQRLAPSSGTFSTEMTRKTRLALAFVSGRVMEKRSSIRRMSENACRDSATQGFLDRPISLVMS